MLGPSQLIPFRWSSGRGDQSRQVVQGAQGLHHGGVVGPRPSGMFVRSMLKLVGHEPERSAGPARPGACNAPTSLCLGPGVRLKSLLPVEGNCSDAGRQLEFAAETSAIPDRTSGLSTTATPLGKKGCGGKPWIQGQFGPCPPFPAQFPGPSHPGRDGVDLAPQAASALLPSVTRGTASLEARLIHHGELRDRRGPEQGPCGDQAGEGGPPCGLQGGESWWSCRWVTSPRSFRDSPEALRVWGGAARLDRRATHCGGTSGCGLAKHPLAEVAASPARGLKRGRMPQRLAVIPLCVASGCAWRHPVLTRSWLPGRGMPSPSPPCCWCEGRTLRQGEGPGITPPSTSDPASSMH